MFSNIKNPNKQGDAGMGIAIGWFASNGYCVSIPLTDSQDYDLVVEINNVLKKVQVKTTTSKTKYKIYKANLRVNGGNRSGTGKTKKFDWKSVDYLFIVTNNNDKYIIPTFPTMPKNSIALGEQYQQYKV
jgi:hypothetical protein